MTYLLENDRYLLSIVYANGILNVKIEGSINLDDSYIIWQKISEKSTYFSCKRIFIKSDLESIDRSHAFQYKDLFDELCTPWTFKIAWAEENPQNRENIRYIGRVIGYWGLNNISYVDSEDSAKDWLLETRKLTGSY
ncbi:hypothetical protein G3570_00045 [Balneolaceae bacterium YR4-1]|uniref:STAS/SEC14 domain-containing protein n=1 Tax=Halalkalibaculum roseum TaxID=2709311 RepID=A0A6M1SVN4_9BACT|nr:hypothetical protein [Halalkalibaculum roseum]NGP75004.1 hypothetical protein [Halalkalibaculum roseum]